MPLFGSSNTHDNNLNTNQMDNTGYNNTQTTGPGMGRTHEPRLANDPLAPGTGTAGMGEPGMGNTTHAGGGRHHAGGMHNDEMMAGGAGTGGVGTGGAGTGGAAIPPTSAFGSQHQQQPESGAGGVTGAKQLQAKGLQMEQEAQAMKVQSRELAEAERLENEARLRRERAVNHGAHPDNRHVGGIAPDGSRV
ncbi:hypothetical protein B0H17DRAFT_1263113 [Mycena rosella]|uniref:Uncharacterized protein n=1 Tax=Mycena rosella TaxID=1033263 RepID=A0AAD7DQW5_MYCRO|nr:hypothetical protein B0H17DRAFT_1263113 [Mycena rosella]